MIDGRFLIVRELGRGGMGVVYVVFDRETCRELALKRIYPDGVGKPHLEERFRREFRALGAIQDPGVPKLFHTGRTADGVPWFTMDVVGGEPLRAVLDRGRPTPLRALELAIALGRILAAAHAAGVIHRDVKPGNIMLEPGGQVRLLDFGILSPLPRFLRHAEARRRTVDVDRWSTGEARFAGTIGYSDPATYDGSPATVRSDIFSLAAILYEMLTGRRLFDGDAHCFRAIDSAEFPPSLAPLAADLREAAALNPFERPRSMALFVQRLEIARGNLMRGEASARTTARGLTLLLCLVSVVFGIAAALVVQRLGSRDPATPSALASPPVAPVEPAPRGPLDAPDIAGRADPDPPAAPRVAPPDASSRQLSAAPDAGPAGPAAGRARIGGRRRASEALARSRVTKWTSRVQACVDIDGAPTAELAVLLAFDSAGHVRSVSPVDETSPILIRCIGDALKDLSLPPGSPPLLRYTFRLRRPSRPGDPR